MSGINFLLDTNIMIGLTKGHDEVLYYLQDHAAEIARSGYSFITRIELLGYPGITDLELTNTSQLLEAMRYIPSSPAIEEMTIQIRRQYRLKIPDAIIAATAKVHCLELLTLDQQLANRMTDILG